MSKLRRDSDFEVFQKEFKMWQGKLGLLGYKVYFKHEPLKGAYADISIDQGSMIAVVRLDSVVSDEDQHRDVRQSAKHEALHLLTGRLEQNGRYRYATECELSEAAEELVIKLEQLIS